MKCGFLITLCCLASITKCFAADIEVSITVGRHTDEKRIYVSLNGAITEGDTERIRELTSEALQLYDYPDSDRIVVMDSTGGSYREGVRLHDFFRNNKFRSYVGEGSKCLSACAVAFLGGANMNEGWAVNPDRIIHPRAVLGFHAPSLNVRGDAMVPASMLSTSYGNALESISALIKRIESSDIPRSLVETIISTPPDSMYEVETLDDAARWNISVAAELESREPTAIEIARLCMNYPSWSQGKPSFYKWFDYKGEVTEGVKNADFAKSQEKQFSSQLSYPHKGRFSKYAHIQTSDYEIEEHCVVQIYKTGGMSVYTSDAYAEAAIQSAVNATMIPNSFSLIHTNPSDTRLSELRPDVSGVWGQNDSGRCTVGLNGTLSDDEPCTRSVEGRVLTFNWPSGSKTVIDERSQPSLINGSQVNSTSISPNRACWKNTETKREFCYTTR